MRAVLPCLGLFLTFSPGCLPDFRASHPASADPWDGRSRWHDLRPSRRAPRSRATHPAASRIAVFNIGQRFDCLVDPGVDPNQVHPRPPRERKSPGTVVGPAHSLGCRAQKSTHPGGGCVTSKTSARHSDPARAVSTPMALAASATTKTIPNFAVKNL